MNGDYLGFMVEGFFCMSDGVETITWPDEEQGGNELDGWEEDLHNCLKNKFIKGRRSDSHSRKER